MPTPMRQHTAYTMAPTITSPPKNAASWPTDQLSMPPTACTSLLNAEYKDIQTELSPLYADVKRLWAIHYNIYEVQHEQERQQTQLHSRKTEIEL